MQTREITYSSSLISAPRLNSLVGEALRPGPPPQTPAIPPPPGLTLPLSSPPILIAEGQDPQLHASISPPLVAAFVALGAFLLGCAFCYTSNRRRSRAGTVPGRGGLRSANRGRETRMHVGDVLADDTDNLRQWSIGFEDVVQRPQLWEVQVAMEGSTGDLSWRDIQVRALQSCGCFFWLMRTHSRSPPIMSRTKLTGFPRAAVYALKYTLSCSCQARVPLDRDILLMFPRNIALALYVHVMMVRSSAYLFQKDANCTGAQIMGCCRLPPYIRNIRAVLIVRRDADSRGATSLVIKIKAHMIADPGTKVVPLQCTYRLRRGPERVHPFYNATGPF